LMTETWNGELASDGGANRDAASAAVMATIPARISRRANWTGMTCSWNHWVTATKGAHQSTTIETLQDSPGRASSHKQGGNPSPARGKEAGGQVFSAKQNAPESI
jgi:hypothetical protein